MSKLTKKRIIVILYSGDYYDAYKRMITGQGEAYHHHNYALNELSRLSTKSDVEEVAVLSCATPTAYDHFLDIGFRVIGTGFNPWENRNSLIHVLENFRPTHIVLRCPILFLLEWSIQNRVKLITLLADSFGEKGLISRYRNFRLARLLNHPRVEWVGNHHINSCLSLQRIGVSPHKIVPWDWPQEDMSPLDFEPKSLLADKKSYSFAYVGSISEAKGVGDLLDALALLKQRGIDANLKIAGKIHEDNPFYSKVSQLKIEDSVHFLGLVPNDKVLSLMRSCDLVFIPSRHSYGEGLPLTIYEALCSRTPIVASDHPMFRNNLEDGDSALIFPEMNPKAIADCVQRLLNDPGLYSRISENAYNAWQKLRIPVIWGDFINRWIVDEPKDTLWLKSNVLSKICYNKRLKS